jgi:hypothetical protein
MLGVPLLYRTLNYQGIQGIENAMRSEFQAIVHPEGAQQLKFSLNSKIVRRWIRAEYKYNNMNDIEVEKYYQEELTKEGWTKEIVSEESYQHSHESFYKKEKYEVSLSPNKDYWIINMYYRDVFDRLGL